MIDTPTHTISELHIELDGLWPEIPSNEVELGLQIRHQLLPDLDALLSEFDEENLYIDELVLELGAHPKGTSWGLLKADIERRLRHALLQASDGDITRAVVRKSDITSLTSQNSHRLTDKNKSRGADDGKPNNIALNGVSSKEFSTHDLQSEIEHQKSKMQAGRVIPIWNSHSELLPFLIIPVRDEKLRQKHSQPHSVIEVIAAAINLSIRTGSSDVTDMGSQIFSADRYEDPINNFSGSYEDYGSGSKDDRQALRRLIDTLIHIIDGINSELASQLSIKLAQNARQFNKVKATAAHRTDPAGPIKVNPQQTSSFHLSAGKEGIESVNSPDANTVNNSSHITERSLGKESDDTSEGKLHRPDQLSDIDRSTSGYSDRIVPDSGNSFAVEPESPQYKSESTRAIHGPANNNIDSIDNDDVQPNEATPEPPSGIRKLLAEAIAQRSIPSSGDQIISAAQSDATPQESLPEPVNTKALDDAQSAFETHTSIQHSNASPEADNATDNPESILVAPEIECKPTLAESSDQQHNADSRFDNDQIDGTGSAEPALSASATNEYPTDFEDRPNKSDDTKETPDIDTEQYSRTNNREETGCSADGHRPDSEQLVSATTESNRPQGVRSRLESLAAILIDSTLDSPAELLKQNLIDQLTEVQDPVLFASKAIMAIAHGESIAPYEIDSDNKSIPVESAKALNELTLQNLQPDELGDLAALIANSSSDTEGIVKSIVEFGNTGIYSSLLRQPETVLDTLLALSNTELCASLRNDPVTRDSLAILSDANFDKLTHFLNPGWDNKEGITLRTLRSVVPANKVTLLKRYSLTSAITSDGRSTLNSANTTAPVIEHAVKALTENSQEARALAARLGSRLKGKQLPEIPVVLSALSGLEPRFASTSVTTSDQDNESTIDTSETNVAGLVLLGPFIPALFERTGLIRNNTFPSELERNTAAALLTWVVQGNSALHNYPGPLERYLAGIPAGGLCVTVEEPPADNRELIESLLTTVCERWSPLANTTNQGLRETFLARDGILSLQPRAQLTVYHKTLDVLLERLPWSIGQLYLPWLDDPLQVNWKFSG